MVRDNKTEREIEIRANERHWRIYRKQVLLFYLHYFNLIQFNSSLLRELKINDKIRCFTSDSEMKYISDSNEQRPERKIEKNK